MIMATKNDIFQEHINRYLKVGKKEKGLILNHVCFVAGMHRKAASRKFAVLQMKDSGIPERRGRHFLYTPDVTAALKKDGSADSSKQGEGKKASQPPSRRISNT